MRKIGQKLCPKCGSLPIAKLEWIGFNDRLYLICEDCQMRTKSFPMAWQASEAWNRDETYLNKQFEQEKLF